MREGRGEAELAQMLSEEEAQRKRQSFEAPDCQI